MILSNITKSYRKAAHSANCSCCHHREKEKFQISNLLLFLPLILAIIIIPKTFADAQKMSEQFVPPGYKECTQVEIGAAAFEARKDLRQKLAHTKIFLRGKVYNSALLKADEIIVYRLEISCCAADGIPMGVVVKLPGKADFQNEEWVGVEGTAQLLSFDEKLKSIDAITSMVPPERIYPYFTATKAFAINPPKHEIFGDYFDPTSGSLFWQLLASALLGLAIFSKRIRYWVHNKIRKDNSK